MEILRSRQFAAQAAAPSRPVVPSSQLANQQVAAAVKFAFEASAEGREKSRVETLATVERTQSRILGRK
jgi:hypothetical protein